MRLQDFAILADESIHREVVTHLRTRGCDVRDVRESGLAGSDDLALMQLAASERRVIVTHDSDFGALAIAQREPLLGLLFLRPGHITPRFTIGTLNAVFDRNLELVPPFIVVAKRVGELVTIRVRGL